VLTLCTFFILLGSRGLNDPDESRYAEIAREMLETGNWLVPHFWYVPHFDKPPLTYWAVAVSMELFGQNEWAVRLPVALAALSGALATWFLTRSIAGQRAAMWAVLILQTSLLYFAMARMLTTDMFLAQFNAWAIYFLWRSWLCLRISALNSPVPLPEASLKHFWRWHLSGWFMIVLGFLTKGPIALAIPLMSILSLVIFRWKTFPRKRLLFGGILGGIALVFVTVSPWFLVVNKRVPHVLHYMIFHQAAGHVLGTTIKSRHGFPFYFFVILAVGLLPWTWLLGWLWRRSHWQRLSSTGRDGWVMLNVWAIFTFTLFSLTHSKLAPYILPIFPALAVMLALRFLREMDFQQSNNPPRWVWLLCVLSPLILAAAFVPTMSAVFSVTAPLWTHWQIPVMIAIGIALLFLARKWTVPNCAAAAVVVAIWSMFVIVEEVPLFDVNFKANQTLKPFGSLLQKNYRPGDAVLCWGQLPEGLPYYSRGVISAANRPYLAGMNLTRLPFEFPGNQERFGDLVITDDDSVAQFLSGNRRVLVVVSQPVAARFNYVAADIPMRRIANSGEWELLSNQ